MLREGAHAGLGGAGGGEGLSVDPQLRLTWTTSLSGEEAKAQEGERASPVSCRPGVEPTEWVRGARRGPGCLQLFADVFSWISGHTPFRLGMGMGAWAPL